MTDETVECFNCGRANPEWAQVCRSCGVVLRHGATPVAAAERIPTDRDSLVSIAAVIGTILAALLLGLFISNLDPTDPTVGVASPSPSATPEPTFTTSAPPTVETPTPSPSPSPEGLPGTLTFGTTLGEDGLVADPTDQFVPGMNFAYSISMPNGFGASPIENEIVLIDETGAELRTVLERDPVEVDPAATTAGYVIGTTDEFIGGLGGAGTFEWRVYVGEQQIAESTFTYTAP